MSKPNALTVSRTKRGVTIKASGAAAQTLFAAICEAHGLAVDGPALAAAAPSAPCDAAPPPDATTTTEPADVRAGG